VLDPGLVVVFPSCEYDTTLRLVVNGTHAPMSILRLRQGSIVFFSWRFSTSVLLSKWSERAES
jgi:hypothetical protein